MKRGTELKLKFKLLKAKLDMPTWQVKGILQSIWDFAEDNAPLGDVGRFSNKEIAVGMEYEGDADALMAALVQTRWLDECQSGRLVIHDWHDHCADWLKKRVSRSEEDFASEHIKPVADSGGQRQTVADNGSLPSHNPAMPGPAMPDCPREADADPPVAEPASQPAEPPAPDRPSKPPDPRTRAFASLKRALGRATSSSDDAHLIRYADSLPATVRIGDRDRDRWELLERALSAAAEHGDCQTAKGAVRYVRQIVERCIQHECWPGEFPDAPTRAGPKGFDARAAAAEGRKRAIKLGS